VINDISRYNGTAVIVRGLPADAKILPSTNDLVFYNHLPAEAYNLEMQKAEYIISRSGYSTIMDILQLGKKAILIPTPGQTEQEYLASFLEHKRYAACIHQQNFSLQRTLEKAARFNFEQPPTSKNNLPTLVASLLQKIASSSNMKARS
jgi:UDP-N-acetylglucosamine:LPS N-acetylglucosamine transferase